jgi:hypothetical protein
VPSNEHRFKVQTSLLKIDFYASQQYFDDIKKPEFKRESEMVIDREYLVELEKTCEGRKREKKRLEEMAYKENPGTRRQNYLNQAKNVELGACRRIAELSEQFEDYIRDLTYMR